MTKKRSSLVENINRRKRRGTSRSKSKSTVSKQSYERMQQGWPQRGSKKSAGRKATKKRAAKKTSKRRVAIMKRTRAPARR